MIVRSSPLYFQLVNLLINILDDLLKVSSIKTCLKGIITMTATKPRLAWLSDPTVFEINRVPAHSDHQFFASKDQTKKLTQSLNGTWRVHLEPDLALQDLAFTKPDFDHQHFKYIQVPGHLQTQG